MTDKMQFEISTPYGNIKYRTHMTTHKLKTWMPYFQDIIDNLKTFELRRNDRDYQVGDTLTLVEVNPDNDLAPTGRECSVEIIYILDGERWGLQPGYVVLGIKYLVPSDAST